MLEKRLRKSILSYHYEVWSRNPDPSGFVGLNEVVSELLNHTPQNRKRCCRVLNSLISDGFLKVVEVKNPSGGMESLSQITKEGRLYLDQRNKQRATVWISAAGIVVSVIIYVLSSVI